MKRFVRLWILVLILATGQVAGSAAGEATVATAANFVVAAEHLKSQFQTRSGHRITVVSGSTGKLASQVALGAPFDVLLAADQVRPRWLVENRHAVAGSQFTYSVGRLVLWSAEAAHLDAANGGPADILKAGRFRRLAIANLALAPDGVAAEEALTTLGLLQQLKPKLIYGENVQQAYAFAASGNAELALVAQSLVRGARSPMKGAFLQLPRDLHQPIRQDAVLLKRGAGNPAAIAFLSFLKTTEAMRIMQELGFETGQAALQ
ncbi:MAG: molybdate ABC transporter substrate-binding protein [Aestuariivirgaceae bacterium]